MVAMAVIVWGLVRVTCRKWPLFWPGSSAVHQANMSFILALAGRYFPNMADHDLMLSSGMEESSMPRGPGLHGVVAGREDWDG